MSTEAASSSVADPHADRRLVLRMLRCYIDALTSLESVVCRVLQIEIGRTSVPDSHMWVLQDHALHTIRQEEYHIVMGHSNSMVLFGGASSLPPGDALALFQRATHRLQNSVPVDVGITTAGFFMHEVHTYLTVHGDTPNFTFMTPFLNDRCELLREIYDGLARAWPDTVSFL